MVFSNFFEFFCYIFWILYYGFGRKCSERKFLFSLFLGLSQPGYTGKEAILVFFNFLYFFFVFFLEFSIRGQVGNDRIDNFYFYYFSAFPNLFWPEKKPYWGYLIFWIFCYFFLILYYGLGKNARTKIFIFTLSRPFSTWIYWERSHIGVF